MSQPTLWRNPEFLKLWCGQTISQIGSRVTREGLRLAAVITLGAGPKEMGLLSFVGAGSMLLVGPVAGVCADRFKRRKILIASDVGRALILASIPLAAWTHRLGMPQLYAVAAIAGIFTIFFDVAYQSYLPVLVERDEVLEGNSKLALSEATSELIGPPLTGVLVQTITAPIAILVDALSYLVSVFSLFLIRRPEPPVQPRHAGEMNWRYAAQGMRFLFRDPYLRTLALWSLGVWFCFGSFGALYVLYAIRDLAITPAILGLIVAVGGIGQFFAATYSERIAARFGPGPALITCAMVTSLAIAFVPLAARPIAFAALCLIAQQLFGDIAFAMFMILETSLRQTLTPNHLLGRVNAAAQLLSRGMIPFGSLAGGFLAAQVGTRAALGAAVGGIILCSAALLFSPLRRLRQMPTPVV